MARNDFNGQTVFVAGGTSGINLGIAEGFAQAGAQVAVLSRSQEKVDSALMHLHQYHPDCIGFAADVRDYDAIDNALKQAHQSLGEIDVLVSGAAGNFPARVLDMSANAFRSVVDIDLIGTFHVLRAGYAYLKKPGSVVINISAPQAFVPTALQAHVCAAKAGVDMLTRVCALEWGQDGVRVNSLVPGPIAGTEGVARLAPTAAMQQAVTESVPLKRMGTVRDIAEAALMLAAPAAGFIHGAIIVVDGGWSLGGIGDLASHLPANIPKRDG
jgi:NAD(P)-dependent dehydrogenase (short-subunit alcohol dehydrogenase family)